MDKNSYNKDDVILEYRYLLEGMRAAISKGILDECDMSNIIQYTNELADFLFDTDDSVWEGVKAIMGGEVLETYADKERKLLKLIECLSKDERFDEIKKIPSNETLRRQLYEEYNIN